MIIEDLDRIDTKHMYKIYNKWPEIAKESFEGDFEKLEFDGIDHIVFAGMGGSGSIGDVIGAILSKKDIHVTNVKGYLLPKTVDENTLVIATSVSGNSIEVLEILKNVKFMPEEQYLLSKNSHDTFSKGIISKISIFNTKYFRGGDTN